MVKSVTVAVAEGHTPRGQLQRATDRRHRSGLLAPSREHNSA